MGALGFEPRSAGFRHAGSDPAGIKGSALQSFITWSANPFAVIPDNWSPRVCRVNPYPHRSSLSFPHLLLSLSAPHSFLAPLPSLITPLLPSARASFHLSSSSSCSCPHSVDLHEAFDRDLAGSSGVSPLGGVSNPRPLTCFHGKPR